MRVLLVEDDKRFGLSIQNALSNTDRFCDVAVSGVEGISMLDTYSYDVVLLDLKLPDISGIEFIQKVRRNKIPVPIVVLSGQHQSEIVAEALNQGADDFITKPANQSVLESRLNAVVRRTCGHSDDIITVGDLVINRQTHSVKICDHPVQLTGKEFAILDLMALRRNQTVVKPTFLDHLYGGIDEPEVKIVDVYICKIRKKISEVLATIPKYKNALDYDYIQTVWGRGYTLVAPTDLEEDSKIAAA